MISKTTILIRLYVFALFNSFSFSFAFNCDLPKNCRIKKIRFIENLLGIDNFYVIKEGIQCQIANNFTFDMGAQKSALTSNQSKSCFIGRYDDADVGVELKWPSAANNPKSSILDPHSFSLSNMFSYFNQFEQNVSLKFMHLAGMQVNLGSPFQAFVVENRQIKIIDLVNSVMEFYMDKQRVRSCGDLTGKRISHLFQTQYRGESMEKIGFRLIACKFVTKLCPRLFENARISYVSVNHLARTFYKTNLLQFTNDDDEKIADVSSMNATIDFLILIRPENIDIDSSLLSPILFSNLSELWIFGFVGSIGEHVFDPLVQLSTICFQTHIFRSLIHRNGIAWIRDLNRLVNVSLTQNRTGSSGGFKLNENERWAIKSIYLAIDSFFQVDPMSHVFPDADFCLYANYPFNQLVFTHHYALDSRQLDLFAALNPVFSCTYLWINQYLHVKINNNNNSLDDDPMLVRNIEILVASQSYRDMHAKCNFERRLELCDVESRKQRRGEIVRDTFGALILIKKIQIGVKITTYGLALFAAITNALVVRVIFGSRSSSKHNFFSPSNNKKPDLAKHYKYLGLVSVFGLVISLIEMVSWLTECFYPYAVFCLGVHKSVGAQLFKMVVGECVVNALQFLCNFCYIAFAVSRIGKISPSPSSLSLVKHQAIGVSKQLVSFVSEVSINKYVAVCATVSVSLAWIRFFKYELNIDQDELNFPISNELDMITKNVRRSFILDVYYVLVCISDLLNFVVCVLVCFGIDVCMVVQLRKTLDEKIARLKSMTSAGGGRGDEVRQMQVEKKCERAMKKSARMVVLNTAVGLLLKLPSAFLPLVFVCAQFYYKDFDNRARNVRFDRFVSDLIETRLYFLIQDVAKLLFLVWLAVQFFIYKHFDGKFKTAKP